MDCEVGSQLKTGLCWLSTSTSYASAGLRSFSAMKAWLAAV